MLVLLGQLLDVHAVPGSVLVEFVLAASDLPGAPTLPLIVQQLMANVQAGDVQIPYSIPLQVDKVGLYAVLPMVCLCVCLFVCLLVCANLCMFGFI